MARYTYAELRSGSIEYEGKKIRTSSLSSYHGARAVAGDLKSWIENGEFQLNRPVMQFPKKAKLNSLVEDWL